MQNIALDIKDAPIHQPYYDQINATSGFVVLAKSKWLNCVCVRGTVASIQALSGLSFVDSVKFFDNTLNFTTNLPNNNAAYKFKKMDAKEGYLKRNCFSLDWLIYNTYLQRYKLDLSQQSISTIEDKFKDMLESELGYR